MANLEVRGLIEERHRTDATIAALHGPPMLNAMRDATMLVTRTARGISSVDTGRLRASIVPEVRLNGDVVQGVVGSNLAYAPFAILGTKPHFPPVSALKVWARRHGVNAFVVARAISRKGTKGDQSLIKGITENAEKIHRLLGDAVGRIISG